jgi:hypothetical protein
LADAPPLASGIGGRPDSAKLVRGGAWMILPLKKIPKLSTLLPTSQPSKSNRKLGENGQANFVEEASVPPFSAAVALLQNNGWQGVQRGGIGVGSWTGCLFSLT